MSNPTEERLIAGQVAGETWLAQERARNVAHRSLFARLCNIAFGADCVVLVGHHVTYQHANGDGDEIASADTLLFSHVLMRAVFGDDAPRHMAQMAQLMPGEREEYLENALDLKHGEAPCQI